MKFKLKIWFFKSSSTDGRFLYLFLRITALKNLLHTYYIWQIINFTTLWEKAILWREKRRNTLYYVKLILTGFCNSSLFFQGISRKKGGKKQANCKLNFITPTRNIYWMFYFPREEPKTKTLLFIEFFNLFFTWTGTWKMLS